MKQNRLYGFSVFVSLLLVVCIYFNAPHQAQAEILPTNILPVSLHDFFVQTLPDIPTSADFGIYTLESQGNNLYLGISAGSPGNFDGALLAVYSQGSMSAILAPDGTNPITEQGLHDMTIYNDELLIAGTDPAYTDDWTMGNVYSYKNSVLTKHRSLPNVIHTLGLWADETGLWAATGAHTGDNATWLGNLFHSSDFGITWDPPQTLSDYRLWDVYKVGNNMYASTTSTDFLTDPQLLLSQDNGNHWLEIENTHPCPTTRLINFKDQLLVANQFLSYLVSLQDSTRTGFYRLPGVNLSSRFNALTQDNQSNLYALTSDNRLIRSSDLVEWYDIASFTDTPVAVSYWPETDQVVVSTKGPQASLWGINASAITDPPMIITPTPTITPTPVPRFWYPFTPPGNLDASWDTAKEYLESLPNLGITPYSLNRFYNNQWQTYLYGLPMGNYPLASGSAYIVAVNQQTEIPLDQHLLTSPYYAHTYSLLPGNNFIGLPASLAPAFQSNNDTVSLSTICLHLNNQNLSPLALEVYNPPTNQTTTYTCGDPDSPEVTFPLSLWIRIATAGTWNVDATPYLPHTDLNADGFTDILDVDQLITHYGQTSAPEDIDLNQTVNLFDYNLMMKNL